MATSAIAKMSALADYSLHQLDIFLSGFIRTNCKSHSFEILISKCNIFVEKTLQLQTLSQIESLFKVQRLENTAVVDAPD